MKKIIGTSRRSAYFVAGKVSGIHKIQPLLFPVLIALFLILSSLQEIIEEVLEDDTHDIDNQILQILRNPQDMSDPIGPRWLEEMMRDFSAMGGVAILTFLTLTAAIYLFVNKRHFKAWFLLGAVWSGTLLTTILKAGFDRPRPEVMPLETYTYTASFPSGHSMMAALVYLTLGGLLAQNEKRFSMKIFILSIAATMTIMVGISRVYLGAHWASDVLAGWLAGCAWALIFWLAENYLLYKLKPKN